MTVSGRRSRRVRQLTRVVAAAMTSLSVIASAGWAQGEGSRLPIVAPSAFASVEVHINARQIGSRWIAEDAGLTGPARIAITYGQPHARGRKVEGGLIPRDTVWRFGANAAATLHTDVDLTLGTLHVPRGDYSLYLRDGSDGWQLIVNRQTGQWGTEYDSTHDLGRTALTHRALAEPMESFTVYLVPTWSPGRGPGDTALRGTLTIMWGSSALSAEWQAIGPT